jgi:hypothetical protein
MVLQTAGPLSLSDIYHEFFGALDPAGNKRFDDVPPHSFLEYFDADNDLTTGTTRMPFRPGGTGPGGSSRKLSDYYGTSAPEYDYYFSRGFIFAYSWVETVETPVLVPQHFVYGEFYGDEDVTETNPADRDEIEHQGSVDESSFVRVSWDWYWTDFYIWEYEYTDGGYYDYETVYSRSGGVQRTKVAWNYGYFSALVNQQSTRTVYTTSPTSTKVDWNYGWQEVLLENVIGGPFWIYGPWTNEGPYHTRYYGNLSISFTQSFHPENPYNSTTYRGYFEFNIIYSYQETFTQQVWISGQWTNVGPYGTLYYGPRDDGVSGFHTISFTIDGEPPKPSGWVAWGNYFELNQIYAYERLIFVPNVVFVPGHYAGEENGPYYGPEHGPGGTGPVYDPLNGRLVDPNRAWWYGYTEENEQGYYSRGIIPAYVYIREDLVTRNVGFHTISGNFSSDADVVEYDPNGDEHGGVIDESSKIFYRSN